MKTSSGTKDKKSRGKKKNGPGPDWVKREKFRKFRLSGMSMYQSAIAAGYSPATAKSKSFLMDRKEKGGILAALDAAGMTERVQAEELTNIALNATKMQNCTVEVRHEDGELTIDDAARVEVPDLHLREATLEHIAKLRKQTNTSMFLPEDGVVSRLIIEVEKEPVPDDISRPQSKPDVSTKPRVGPSR